MENTYYRQDRSFEDWISLEIDHMRLDRMTTAPRFIVPNSTNVTEQSQNDESQQEQQQQQQHEEQLLPDPNHALPLSDWARGYRSLRWLEGGQARIRSAICRLGLYAVQLEYWFDQYEKKQC